MTLLSFSGFGLSFRRYHGLLASCETPVLNDIAFTIGRGEVVALVGASGSGKSLIAHAAFGILPPNARMLGSIRLDGQPVDERTLPALRGRRMALVPQSISHLEPLARCAKQLRWAARRAGRPTDRETLARHLEAFGLDGDAAKAFPHQLSGGMARRMMMAIATVGDADLLIADEPTSGLDDGNAEIVLSKLRGLADQEKGVLLITHSLAAALPYADRVCLIRNGRMEGEEAACAFDGAGEGLRSAYARALWQALPQNGFQVAHHA
ncbi:ATP-binding cassette domain-containing protein [Nitratireductor sp.]|uniref:ATP-binding cassette domain-containing protein n=1 Tax=Nitratireductor sp. TaxID=1872084 RepID=UPI002635BB5C|nr:ATP-binding cassette domain-containing protein [Nitratireductor sp.]MCV0380472.1 ATP-binding cassette domain-containing protein [Nitratireductor sp.]